MPLLCFAGIRNFLGRLLLVLFLTDPLMFSPVVFDLPIGLRSRIRVLDSEVSLGVVLAPHDETRPSRGTWFAYRGVSILVFDMRLKVMPAFSRIATGQFCFCTSLSASFVFSVPSAELYDSANLNKPIAIRHHAAEKRFSNSLHYMLIHM